MQSEVPKRWPARILRGEFEKRRNTLKVTFYCLILFKVEFERDEVELVGKPALGPHPAHGIRP